MNTPILDFTGRYAKSGALRFHMPGHKGRGFLGFEDRDLTEITGADSLYECSGIIAESEKNASQLFGCPSFYSAEGSSQCIKAMLYLALMDAKRRGLPCRILAARNVHKSFLSGAALLDIDVCWLYGREQSYLSCSIDPESLKEEIRKCRPSAVYLTSPDYLGNIQDIEAISEICRSEGLLLLVDNAHGAYLKFLPQSKHPIDLGAHICCDSAHKTLPALTGAAYLHLSPELDSDLRELAKQALLLFGSTSPSYLIMESLDGLNPYLETQFPGKLKAVTELCLELRRELSGAGYKFCGDEPLKLSIDAKAYGYYGFELQEILEKQNIFTEFADPDYLVLMLSPENEPSELELLKKALLEIPRRQAITEPAPAAFRAERVLSPREAMLSVSEELPVEEALGRILASPGVQCPPAVPILICGERINTEAVKAFKYYGIDKIRLIK